MSRQHIAEHIQTSFQPWREFFHGTRHQVEAKLSQVNVAGTEVWQVWDSWTGINDLYPDYPSANNRYESIMDHHCGRS